MRIVNLTNTTTTTTTRSKLGESYCWELSQSLRPKLDADWTGHRSAYIDANADPMPSLYDVLHCISSSECSDSACGDDISRSLCAGSDVI